MRLVAPVRERGLKSAWPDKERHNKHVAPVRERGLKWPYFACIYYTKRRSRKGAWIEIPGAGFSLSACTVAPVRERGLKYVNAIRRTAKIRRSRKGAWIEI